MDMNEKWQRCIGFHGHACKGLLSGFMAALYASRILGLGFSEDEEVVCISECDACSVDAIQVIQMDVESIPAKSFCHTQSGFRQ